MSIKKLTRKVLYKIGGDRFVEAPEWEYIPEGWDYKSKGTQGWNVQTVLDTQKAKWPKFMEFIQGNGPLGLAHEAPKPNNNDIWAHNTIMSYAYALSVVTRMKPKISMLDWGAGIGHYYPLSKMLVPGLEIDYHAFDMPVFTAHGRELLPEAKFYDDPESALKRTYDFVLASGSFQYAKDWKKEGKQLVQAAAPWLLVTRCLMVHRADSHVVIQRAQRYGYETEYLGWVYNRSQVIEYFQSLGMSLEREFLMRDRPKVFNAPEQPECRGFLFKKK